MSSRTERTLGPSPLKPILAPVRAGLVQLRRRVRGLVLLHGLSRLLLILLGMLALQFIVDYTLRLPLGARAFYLVVVAGLLFFVAARRIVRPMLTSLDDLSLARRVEEAHPELGDRLVSGLAFEGACVDPENEESPALMRVVAEQAAGLARQIRFPEVAHGRTAGRWAAAAACLLLVSTVAAALYPQECSTFLQRSVLLRDLEWPRRTNLVVAGMEPGVARRVTLGRETVLQIRAEGAAPSRVLLSYWERDGDAEVGRREVIEIAPSSEDPSLFLFSLHVRTSYGFSVTGGDDDRAALYRIEALRPPAVLSIEMACVYPAYLALEPRTLTGGDQRVPEGTAIRLLMRTNMDLERAALLFGGEPPREMESTGPHTFALDLVADRDRRYSVRLVGANGEENDAGVDTFVLRVAKDHPPIVRILTPNVRTERLPAGVALISFTARDDYRLGETFLQYAVNEGKDRRVLLGGATGESGVEPGGEAVRLRRARTLEDAAAGSDTVLGLAFLDLARLLDDAGKPLEKGAVVHYAVLATDSAGHTPQARGQHRIECITEGDLGHTIEALQQELRELVVRTREHAEARVLESGPEVRVSPEELRHWTGRAQATQARVIDDLDSLSRHLQNVLNLYVFNRLGDQGSADQILPYFETHLLESGDGSGLSFRGGLYRTLRLATEEKAIRAGLGYAKLIEMCDLADRLAADHAPAAYRALARAGHRETQQEAVSASLLEAERERQTIIQGLDRLARLMREWQNFESAVNAFKALRDMQKGVIRDLEGLAGSPSSATPPGAPRPGR